MEYTLKEKCHAHPELFGVDEGAKEGDAKVLLDALYEEGIIPTYSFPKNVVSTYIPDMNGKILYEVERGLDVAIGEYAPGRAIVVDKQTYQIGGFYYPGSERHHGQSLTPARAYAEDPNYVKQILLTSLVKTRHRRSRYLSKYEKCILHVPLPCMVIRQRTTLKAQ